MIMQSTLAVAKEVYPMENMFYIYWYIKDILRQFPPDTVAKNQNTLYIDLGPKFIYVQNRELPVTYNNVMVKK